MLIRNRFLSAFKYNLLGGCVDGSYVLIEGKSDFLDGEESGPTNHAKPKSSPVSNLEISCSPPFELARVRDQSLAEFGSEMIHWKR